MRTKKFPLSLITGMLLLLVGLQLRVIDSFRLTPEATETLARWTGPPEESIEEAVQQFVIDQTSPRKTFTPPRWLGWLFLSLGAIFTTYGLLGRLRS